jgi:hypothetical protein
MQEPRDCANPGDIEIRRRLDPVPAFAPSFAFVRSRSIERKLAGFCPR